MNFDELFANICEALQREQRISYRALRRRFELSDDDLEDLKVEMIEAKRLAIDENDRILVWIGEAGETTASIAHPVHDQKPSPISYTPQYLTEKILTSRSALEGERKVVTVLFADIKDSTELIKDLDPEDAQKLLDPAIHIMIDAVHRFEGTVNQVLGDGIMSIFGAPIAHEDHAARACYAALAMQATMQGYTEEVRRTHGIPLQIRVGLNSGEVVVRTITSDLHMDYSAVGQTTHLAARMEQLATPGSIVLSGSTLRLVEGLVQIKALGPIPVKGLPEPVEVYELTGASSIRRRLQAAVAGGLTRFVGRETEMASLDQALEQVGAGHGQVVAVVAEAGMGKSRLAYEFVHSHRTRGWRVLESASVSYGKATPYFPVVDLLKRYVHVEDGDDPRTTRAKVTGQILILDESLQETIPALLALVDALPEDSPFLQLDPPQRRQRTLDGLKRILLRESQVQPLLVVFEDLHWIDSETQALLDNLVESLPTAQLLLLLNYRPEYQHRWGSKTYYTQLRLDPLPPESADEFLQALLGSDPSLEPLKTLLIERTEGNPFFLEESARTLVETQELVGAPGRYRLAQELPTIQIPATVQAVLAARIDRLQQEEKRLLQTAAVIGTEVPCSLLQAIAEMPEETLYRGLTHLQAAEFLYETSLFPERIYTFKHALTHEVAYGSLLQERRRMLHAQIVEALETLDSERLAEQVERLAYHALRGEVWDKALMYFRRAGQKAMEQSAYQEAVVCFEQALQAVQHLPERRDTLEQAIDLRFDLRNALLPLGEHGRIFDHLQVAESLSEALGDPHRLGHIGCYMCIYFRAVGDHDRAIAAGQRALTLAEAHDDFEVYVVANAYLGLAYDTSGDYRQALIFSQRVVEVLDSDRLHMFFGQVSLPAVTCRVFAARSFAELGRFAEGMAIGEEGVRIAEAIDHPYNRITAYAALGFLYQRKGDLHKVIPMLEQSVALCKEVHNRLFFPQVAALLVSAYALAGRSIEAQHVIEQIDKVPQAWNVAETFVDVGEAYLRLGRQAEANAHARRALALSSERRQHGTEARARWLLGDIAMHHHPPDTDPAEIHYQQALSLANELGMRPLQAHCHRGLGTLYSQTDQLEQARAELSTARAMYRDTEMTFWLPETEAALAHVEGQ